MKQFRQILRTSLFVVVPFFLSIILLSCNYYNFSQPQPVDKGNIYEFPPLFRGIWVEKPITNELTVDPGNSFHNFRKGPFNQSLAEKSSIEDELNATDSAWYHIEKDFALFIVHDKERIVAGASILADEEALSRFRVPNSSKNIQYSFSFNTTDTIDYLIRGNKIYELTGEQWLEKGYSFLLENDTIVVLRYDTICVDLGQNAFLRKLNETFYILNIRNSILGEENTWWRLIVLEKNNDSGLNLWECNSKCEKLPSMFYSRSSNSDAFYFDSQWSTAEMLDLVRKGYFSVHSTLIKNHDQTNN